MMVFKFIDHDGQTHLIECTAVTFLGSGDEGNKRAWGVDGEAAVNYDLGDLDGGPQMPCLYFVVARSTGRRLVLGSHMRGAWLLNDQGKTLENLMALQEPIPFSSNGATTNIYVNAEVDTEAVVNEVVSVLRGSGRG